MTPSVLLQSTVDILRTLIAFDTVSRNSNLFLMDYVQGYLQHHKAEVTLLHNDLRNKAALVARIGPDVKGGLVLSGHSDVVPVDGQVWDTPPFVLTEKDGKLFGRGTSDMKAFLAIALAITPWLNKQKLKKPVYFVFSYDEEIGCLAAPKLAKYLQELNIDPALLIIGEPTECKLVHAHKGIRSFETIVTGLEAHSSLTHKGVNAVYAACELVGLLQNIAKEYQTKGGDARFDPPYSTIHVGVIEGGTARNIIPGHCRFAWEIRPLPGEDTESILKRFEEASSRIQADMQKVHPQVSIVTRGLSNVMPVKADPAVPLASVLMQIAGTNHMETVSFGTEGGMFQHHGFPVVVWGPGSIEQAHKPNEFITLSQIETYISLMQQLVNKNP